MLTGLFLQELFYFALGESVLLFVLFGLSAWWSFHLPILVGQFPPAISRFCAFVSLFEPLEVYEAGHHKENPYKLEVIGWDDCLLDQWQHDLIDDGLISSGDHSSI